MQVTHVDFLQVLTEGLGVAKGIGSDVGLGHAIYLPDLYRAHARNASFDSAYLSLRCHFDDFLHGALDLVLTEFIGGMSADFVILLTEAALIVTPLAFGLYSVLGCRLYGSSMLVMIFNDEMTFQLNHRVEDIKVDSLQHVRQYTSSLTNAWHSDVALQIFLSSDIEVVTMNNLSLFGRFNWIPVCYYLTVNNCGIRETIHTDEASLVTMKADCKLTNCCSSLAIIMDDKNIHIQDEIGSDLEVVSDVQVSRINHGRPQSFALHT